MDSSLSLGQTATDPAQLEDHCYSIIMCYQEWLQFWAPSNRVGEGLASIHTFIHAHMHALIHLFNSMYSASLCPAHVDIGCKHQ